jgi:DNA-binding ferritin-like protein (Dps family)
VLPADAARRTKALAVLKSLLEKKEPVSSVCKTFATTAEEINKYVDEFLSTFINAGDIKISLAEMTKLFEERMIVYRNLYETAQQEIATFRDKINALVGENKELVERVNEEVQFSTGLRLKRDALFKQLNEASIKNIDELVTVSKRVEENRKNMAKQSDDFLYVKFSTKS